MTANSSPVRTRFRALFKPRVVRLLLLCVPLLLVLRFTNWLESRVFYFPSPASRQSMAAPSGAIDAFFPGPDGATLHGWLMLASTTEPGPHPTILHCHGNAGNIRDHADFSMFLAAKGYNVFLFDFRGYGASDPGPHHRDALMADTRAALDALANRPEVDPARIGVLGVSIGCVFAAELAATDDRVRACVLAAPFASWSSIAGT
ncbi:MAG: alpha/beta hydrolase, partial [Phycisphaerales bacterium]